MLLEQNKTKTMVFLLKERQLCLIKGKNASDSKGIFTAAIYLEGCANRPNKGLIDRIQLTKFQVTTWKIRVPADHLLFLYSLWRVTDRHSSDLVVSDWGSLHCTFLWAHRLPAATRLDVHTWAWSDKSYSVNAIFVFQMRMDSKSRKK